MKKKLLQKYRFVFEEEFIKEIASVGDLKIIKPESTLIDIGDELTHMPLVMSGSIRIMREDKDGNEILLYY